MCMNEKKITSVIDAINIVKWGSHSLTDLNAHVIGYEKIFPHGTWFRGQEKYSWPLLASIFRRNEKGNLLYASNESQLVKHFKLHFAVDHGELTTMLDWLCLMQHHRCPTRLLDWSENILVALYFSVLDDKETNDEPGSLYVLNSFKLNYSAGRNHATRLYADDFLCWLRAQLAEDTTFDALAHQLKNERPADLRQFRKWQSNESTFGKYLSRPVAFWPRYVHDRMHRQQSVLVVEGGTLANDKSGIPEPSLLEELNNSLGTYKFMEKFEIPPEKKQAIREELRAIGIHIGSLFPEMEHQSQYIRESWTAKIDKKR
jgi:hypothetical protein